MQPMLAQRSKLPCRRCPRHLRGSLLALQSLSLPRPLFYGCGFFAYSWKLVIRKRPIKEGKRPISANGLFSGTPPWWKTAPLKRPIERSMIVKSKYFIIIFISNNFGCSFFAYSWKLPAYSGAFYLQLTIFCFFTYSWSVFAYSFSFLLTVGAFLLTVGKCV